MDYIACEDMDFAWSKEAIEQFKQLWRDEIHLRDIASILDRDPDEVVLLAIDLARKNIITQRESGKKRKRTKRTCAGRPKGSKNLRMDVEHLRKLYMDRSLGMDDIAKYFGTKRRRVHQIIAEERAKAPEEWPSRHRRIT